MANKESNKYVKSSLKGEVGKDVKSEVSETKKTKSVVKGRTISKQSEISKIKNSIISDSIGGIKDYIIYDVIIPNILESITTGLKGSIDMFFHGEVRKNHKGGNGRVSYGEFYGRNAGNISYARDDRDRDEHRSNRLDYNSITFEVRDDALCVIDSMNEIIDAYGHVTVAELFDLAGISVQQNVDNKHGWRNINSADVYRTRQGDYKISFPRPRPIG